MHTDELHHGQEIPDELDIVGADYEAQRTSTLSSTTFIRGTEHTMMDRTAFSMQ